MTCAAGIVTLQALACILILQGAIATGLFIRVNQSGCHNSNILLNCPSYNQSQEIITTVRWRFKVPSLDRWEYLASIRRGKAKLSTSSTHFRDRMTLHPNGSLEITSLKAHDETHYQCLVRAPGRRDSHLIDLSVACDGKITITKRQVCIEEQVHLECEAKHRTNPRHIKRVTWHKKATDASWSLAAASDRHGDLKLNQNGSLVLKAGRKEGDEEYRCAVSKTNAWRDERHIITLKNVNCRRERRQIANIKTTTGRVGMTTSAPIKGTKVSMETTTVPSSTPNQAAKGCGGTLAAPTGGFQSPNFPSAYPANSYCKWTISVPQDYAAIHIKLDQMNLEHEDDCLNDYIAIYDELGNEVGCRRCGAYNSPIETKIRGRVAVVVFKSDSTEHRTGFKLTYTSAKDAGDSDP